jgi:DNA-directed RNA polymerase subunit RPC12/RpoP
MWSVALLDLRCPNGCEEGRFEALNAPLIVDRAGRYVEHDASTATYVCARCQSVAVDLAGAAREMRHAEERGAPVVLRCPACGLEMLPPEDDPMTDVVECPACETRFSVEEGMDHLLGGGGASAAWG